MSNETKTTSNKPAFYAYEVKDRDGGRDAIWTKLGAAFTHKDGKGFDVLLPFGIKITLRVPSEAPADQA